MAPLLLDRRHLTTLGIAFVFFLLLCLAIGYAVGYQQAIKASQSNSSIHNLSLPDAQPAEVMDATISPAIAEPGEDVDVDTPDVIEPVEEEVEEMADVALSSVSADAEPDDDAVISEKLEINDNADEYDAKYSIQVGLFGNKINAERRVEELLSKELSGYLNSFINDKGDTLYNVRFGHFLDKKSVITALDIYQQQYTGDGYIVRFKR